MFSSAHILTADRKHLRQGPMPHIFIFQDLAQFCAREIFMNFTSICISFYTFVN